MRWINVLMATAVIGSEAATAAVMIPGYTVGSGLLSPNGETLFADVAAAGGDDASDGDGTNDTFTVLIDGAGQWELGDTVEITGMALTIHGATANGTMTFEVLQGSGGAGDTGAGSLASLGATTASYENSGTTETLYVQFDTPIGFMADANSAKIGINISNSGMVRLKHSSSFPITRYDRTTGNATSAMRVSVAGSVTPPSTSNNSPVFSINPIDLSTATEITPYAETLAGLASDSDGDSVNYAKQDGPGWLQVAANGTLSGTPAQSDVGTNAFTVVASDGKGGFGSAILRILVVDQNDPPVFNKAPIGTAPAREGREYAATLAGYASDPEGGALTYSRLEGPDWLLIAADGSISGAPASADTGMNHWTVQVDDGNGGSATTTLHIQVLGVSEEQTKPNILYILADDLGYADISANGWQSLEFSTPQIDRIFNGGLRAKAGYVSNSVCSPSRAGLLTGRSGSRFGFEANIGTVQWEPGSRIGLDPGQKTIPDVLKTVGYKTFGLGKWHLGANKNLFHPNIRGFDEWYGFIGGSRSYWQITDYDIDSSIEHNGVWVQEPADMYTTDFLTDQALAYIEDQTLGNPDQPWFMYLSYNAPHGPMHAKAEDIARVPLVDHFGTAYDNAQRRIYGGMVLSLDDNVGRLLERLDALGISEKTMVVFHSDNGGPMAGQNWSRNNPLRGKKGELWEGGIRVPFAVCWPGTIPPGQVAEHGSPVSSLDMMPTFAAVSGADQLQKIRTDGMNLMPFLTNAVASTAPRTLFWRRGDTTKIAMRSGNYKYYSDRTADTTYLFNHGNGSGEYSNLAGSESNLLAQLQAEWSEFEATIPDPQWNASDYLFAIATYDLAEAVTNQPYYLKLTQSPPGTPVTWRIVSGKPEWLNIDPSTGVLSGRPSVTNAYHNYIHLEIEDGSGRTSGYRVPLRVSGSNNIGFMDWKAVHGIPEGSIDRDGDGVSDLTEYALGGDPNKADAVGLPTLTVGADALDYRYVRRRGQALNFDTRGVEVLDGVWASAPVSERRIGDRGDGFEEVSETLAIDPSREPQWFVRLDIEELSD